MSARSLRRFDYADTLHLQVKALDLEAADCVREYRPLPDRKFRLDLAWPARKFYVETDGGEHLGHASRRHGGAADCERAAALVLAGWSGIRFVGSQVISGYAIHTLARLFGRRRV